MAKHHSLSSDAAGKPLLGFVCDTLVRSGCELLLVEGRDRDGFRLSFEHPLLQRAGLCGFLFPLRPSRARRSDTSTTVQFPDAFDGGAGIPEPSRLYTSVLLGVDPDRGLFVAFDPGRHFAEDEPLRVSISAEMVKDTLETGLHTWLREGWEERDFDFAEMLVGFRRERLLHYLTFERIAEGLDTGHRSLLAEKVFDVSRERRRAK